MSFFFSFCFLDYNNIGKFLNRILGMEVHQQNALFQYFSDTLTAVIQEAKKNGRYDMGILGKIIFIINLFHKSRTEKEPFQSFAPKYKITIICLMFHICTEAERVHVC